MYPRNITAHSCTLAGDVFETPSAIAFSFCPRVLPLARQSVSHCFA